MRIYFNDKKKILSEAAVTRIESRTANTLNKFRDDVRSIIITLENANGPRGGIDKVCTILVSLRNRKAFFVTDIDVSASKVVASAIERISHSIGRKLDRRNNRSRARLQFEV